MLYRKENIVLLKILFLICFTCLGQGVKVKIGSEAPKISAHEWVKGNPVTELQKGSVYLIEFGATWCGPCKPAISHLTELKLRHGDDLEVIGFFVMENQTGIQGDQRHLQKVRDYVERMDSQIQYTVAIDDLNDSMAKAWVDNGVPQAYIVNGNGLIAWKGNPNSQEMDRAVQMILNGSYDLSAAIEEEKSSLDQVTEFNRSLPLLMDGNGGEKEDVLFRSLLMEYDGGIRMTGNDYMRSPRIFLNCGPECKEDHTYDLRSVQLIGFPLSKLYQVAYADTVSSMPYTHPNIRKFEQRTSYGTWWPETILEVDDPNLFQWSHISTNNRYNYSLVVPMSKGTSKDLQELMRKDLENYFDYEVSVETRDMPYWSLVNNGFDKNKEIDRNKVKKEYENGKGLFINDGSMRRLVNVLYWSNQLDPMPIIDETLIESGDAVVKADIKDFESLRLGIEKVGLKLVRSTKPMKVVVVKDKKRSNG